ncbi:hypothetical protein DPMN_185522 [Dreissena polymorpha]|uniref:Uncharacterized protein n=1 Tax=Dreissena polymorpha TaxID=45954 RepID=A0A9D4DMY8_DREPO|nr:hypothetical protein DPMN_185522 [Dreissena polymorpha]
MFVLAVTDAAPLEIAMPSELADCLNKLTPLVNTTGPKRVPGLETPEEVHLYCVQQFLWSAGKVRWDDYNITKKDKDFVNDLLASVRMVAFTILSSFLC